MTSEGTSNSVAPIEAIPGVKISESAGSRQGQHNISAGNERIPNVGEGGTSVFPEVAVCTRHKAAFLYFTHL
eukprot:6526326-Heterocapsa_arctica.AAC.1